VSPAVPAPIHLLIPSSEQASQASLDEIYTAFTSRTVPEESCGYGIRLGSRTSPSGAGVTWMTIAASCETRHTRAMSPYNGLPSSQARRRRGSKILPTRRWVSLGRVLSGWYTRWVNFRRRNQWSPHLAVLYRSKSLSRTKPWAPLCSISD
jgi:hypothetical protein